MTDPEGSKTYGSYGSGSTKLVITTSKHEDYNIETFLGRLLTGRL
jgi:hypothetical protein